VVPKLVREATDRSWWDPLATSMPAAMPTAPAPGVGSPAVLPRVEADVWERLTLAPRVVSPLEPAVAHAIVLAGIRDGAAVAAAVEGTTVIGLAMTRHADHAALTELLALGVAPDWRQRGLATRLLASRLEWSRPGDTDHEAMITVADRDPIDPLDVALRVSIARRLFARAGYEIAAAPGVIGAADRTALRATRKALSELDLEP
jgi:GNAT superfamily N-acetyltransferase